MKFDENNLADSLKEDKEYAFKQLVILYQKRLYYHIRKIVISHDDADDVLQNTFLKVWNNIDNFRQESSLYTWLYRIATNEAITFLNSKRKKSYIPLQDAADSLMSNLKTDPYFDGDEIQMKLQQAILMLPDKQRIVFNMKYFDEIKYEDMAKILNTSVGALKASFHHAVKKIENYLLNTD
ncbi:MAG: RNA polymerase sigma factor [Bacteroidales bacterium]|nr:RNA polymerase sigma factor [Bacteroidales bacterium]